MFELTLPHAVAELAHSQALCSCRVVQCRPAMRAPLWAPHAQYKKRTIRASGKYRVSCFLDMYLWNCLMNELQASCMQPGPQMDFRNRFQHP